MEDFERFIGIDYSGAKQPSSPVKGLQVYQAVADQPPSCVGNPLRSDKAWTRRDLHEWLREILSEQASTLVGLDHAFSLPQKQLGGVESWDEFLRRFTSKWQTDERAVEAARKELPLPTSTHELRLTEKWSASAKSVFATKGPGVFHSTFSGIPWLLRLREQSDRKIHFWPFDGWNPKETSSVVVEVYPALFKRRYEPRDGTTPDQHDAFCIVRWFQDMTARGILREFFVPPLLYKEKRIAQLEGWIFGAR